MFKKGDLVRVTKCCDNYPKKCNCNKNYKILVNHVVIFNNKEDCWYMVSPLKSIDVLYKEGVLEIELVTNPLAIALYKG